MAAAQALARGTRMLEPHEVAAACAAQGVDHHVYVSALRALKQDDLVALQVAEPSTIVLLAVTNKGLGRHLRTTRPDLPDVARRLWQVVADAAGQGPQPLDEQVGEPALLVEWLLDRWVNERRLLYSKAPGRRFRIHRLLSPGARPATSEPAP